MGATIGKREGLPEQGLPRSARRWLDPGAMIRELGRGLAHRQRFARAIGYSATLQGACEADEGTREMAAR